MAENSLGFLGGVVLASTLLAIPFVSVLYIVMEGFSERRRARKGDRKRTLENPGAQDRRLNGNELCKIV